MSKQRLGTVVDLALCIGCNACAVACKQENDVPLTKFNTWVESWDVDDGGRISRANLPKLCNHCENPACVKVCPTKAHYKRAEDGLVVIDRDKCIGCGMCAQACPYGAPQLDEKARKMMKCDGCLDRLEKGGAPICVEACPQRAISFGEISELRRTFGTLAVTPPLPDPAQTRPALVIVPSPKAK